MQMFAAAVAASAAAGSRLRPWADSSAGIHTILIGDGHDSDAQIKQLATQGAAPDFVWGGGLRWKKYNPHAVSTKYVAFAPGLQNLGAENEF